MNIDRINLYDIYYTIYIIAIFFYVPNTKTLDWESEIVDRDDGARLYEFDFDDLKLFYLLSNCTIRW